MTPTLVGRWQTRLLLLATLGVVISAVFWLATGRDVFFSVLLYVALFGVVWDVLYIWLQEFRWERDWPAAFQVLNGIVEGAVVYAAIELVGLPGISKGLDPLLFAAHYGTVWLVIFLAVQGPMRALLPFWRFHGGRVFPDVSSGQRG